MFNFFKNTKNKDKNNTTQSNRLIDIRIGREYARARATSGNTYECLHNTALDIYNRSIENSDDLKGINKSYFIEGYEAQTEELSKIISR